MSCDVTAHITFIRSANGYLPVIAVRFRISCDAVHPLWEAMYLHVIAVVGCSIHTTPAATAVVLNATRAIHRHGSRREKRTSCRYRITM